MRYNPDRLTEAERIGYAIELRDLQRKTQETMKNKYLRYKLLSNEFTGMKKEFSTKREAIEAAKWQVSSGWNASVVDMRSGATIWSVIETKAEIAI